jgi:hypothetical protein
MTGFKIKRELLKAVPVPETSRKGTHLECASVATVTTFWLVRTVRLLPAHWTVHSRLDKQIVRQQLPAPQKKMIAHRQQSKAIIIMSLEFESDRDAQNAQISSTGLAFGLPCFSSFEFRQQGTYRA